MLKFHKKLHHRRTQEHPGGTHCCTPVFVNRPDWGDPPPGAPLPMRWIKGVRIPQGSSAWARTRR
jgi:hypothetical protein